MAVHAVLKETLTCVFNVGALGVSRVVFACLPPNSPLRASPPMLNKRSIPIFGQMFESDGTHRHRSSNLIFALRLDRQFGAQTIDPKTGDLDQYEPFQLACPIQNKDRSRDSTDMIWIVISRE